MAAFQPERRALLAQLAAGGALLACSRLARAQDVAGAPSLFGDEQAGLAPVPARWWKALPRGEIECGLCPRRCRVSEGERGTCGVRENRGGRYYTLVHSRPVALNVDPIEKKPFFHVLPGEQALSLATVGCNFECRCCQNWEIAQARPEQIHPVPAPPDRLAAAARQRGIPLLACTYSEPVVWSEYVCDIAAAGRKLGIKTVVVSNGYLQAEPLDAWCDVAAAVKIDLKGFTESFYRSHCNGELKPVLDTLRHLRRRGTWTEIVVLLIPTLNDGEAEIRALARFVRDDLGPDVPVHFTRFFPAYRLVNLPPTPIATLARARAAALDEGLHFVYVGNAPGEPGESTYCPGCKALLIERFGLLVRKNRLKHGACPDCGRASPGVWR